MNARELLFLAVVASSLLATPSFVSANDPGSFNSEQLSRVRQVSQSLLQVRGQRRQLAVSQSAQELEKLDEIKGLLQQARKEASMLEVVKEREVEVAPAYELTSNSEEESVFDRVVYFAGKYFSSSKKEKVKEIKSLDRALVAATEAREAMSSKVTPKWNLWADRNERAESRLKLLEELEEKISGLSEQKRVSSKEIDKLYKELAGAGGEDRSKLDPTIYTITKHVK